MGMAVIRGKGGTKRGWIGGLGVDFGGYFRGDKDIGTVEFG